MRRPDGWTTMSPRLSGLTWLARAVHSWTTRSAHVEPAGGERDVGPGVEDAGDVVDRLLALGSLARRVVLEDHVGRVQRADALQVVGVPRVVVGGDGLMELVGGGGCHAQSMGRYPLVRGAEAMSTLASSSPSLRTVRRCWGSRRANVPARAGWFRRRPRAW